MMSKLIRCVCGNMFDPEKTPSCPECGRDSNSPVRKTSKEPSNTVKKEQAMPAVEETGSNGERQAVSSSSIPPSVWKIGAGAISLLLLALLFKQFSSNSESTTPPVANTSSTPENKPASVCTAALGSWQWYIGGLVTFSSDQTAFFSPVKGASPTVRGTWSCEDSSGTFTVVWEHGYTDVLKVLDNGAVISGTNNVGAIVSGRR